MAGRIASALAAMHTAVLAARESAAAEQTRDQGLLEQTQFNIVGGPASAFLYDMRYTTALPLQNGYEEQQFISAITGLWNRYEPNLLVLLEDIDFTWLNMTNSTTTYQSLPDLQTLITTFAPIGVVLFDPDVPSTSLLASTISGSDGLLPVPYRPADHTSLYTRVVVSGPRIPVLKSLVGMFNSTTGLLSAKANAYAWAIAEQLLSNKSDGRFLGYYGDWFCGSNAPYDQDPSVYDKITVANQDWTIAQGGFLFDLGSWADEAPVDDPGQPLGTDVAVLRSLLYAAYNQTLTLPYSTLVHISGFTPWWCKYVGSFSKHNHGGVDAEWNTALLTSAYNSFVDADACCIGNMASASFWQHFSLPERLLQRPPPTRQHLIEQGLMYANGTVPVKLYYYFYAGDFDSAAWAYSQLLPHWSDPSRGSVPIGWPVDPELSLRFPLLFQVMYSTATPADVIITGDSGAGYVNPTAMWGPTRANISGLPDGQQDWISWNSPWYRQFGMTYTGFVITGDAPQMDAADIAVYANFSGNGMAVQGFPGTTEHLAANLPVVGQTDIPTDAPSAVKSMMDYLPSSGATQPRFWMFRSVLTTPSYLLSVSQSLSNASSDNAAVDPLTQAYLMRAAQGGHNDDRVAYIEDTLPSSAPAGQPLSFNLTVRNDGWNDLAAANHSIIVSVSLAVYSHMEQAQRPTRLGAPMRGPADLHRDLADGTLARFPANPARASILLKRYEMMHATRSGRWTGRPITRDLPAIPFPSVLPAGGQLNIAAVVPLDQCSVDLADGEVAVAEVQYQVAAIGADGSTVLFQANGNIPWVSAVILQ